MANRSHSVAIRPEALQVTALSCLALNDNGQLHIWAVQLRRYGRESEGEVARAGGWAVADTVRCHAGVWDEVDIWEEPIGTRLGL
jgi:hypothetical protein